MKYGRHSRIPTPDLNRIRLGIINPFLQLIWATEPLYPPELLLCDYTFVTRKLDASVQAGASNHRLVSLISSLSALYVLPSKNVSITHIS